MSTYSCARAGLTLLSFTSIFLKIEVAAEELEKINPPQCEQKLSLEAFRAYALNNSPLVAEIDRDYANQLAEAFNVDVLPNPELQIEHTYTGMKLGGANDPQSQVSIGQAIRISNFGSRSKVASLITKSGDLERRAQILELTQKLTIQFKTLSTFQQIEKLFLDSEARATKKVTLIKDGVKKGLLTQGDEYLFEGEKYRLQAQAKNITSTIAILQAELSKATGSPCSIISSEVNKFESLPSEEALLQKAKASEISESSRIERLTNLRSEQVRLSELDAFPQISPRFVYQHTNDGGDFYGAGITIPLPFWNRNQGEIQRTKAQQKVENVKSNFLANGGLTMQIVNLRKAAINAQEQAEIFTTKVIPSFEGALLSQERLYGEGKGNILQVWQTLRAFNEVQTQTLQLWLEVFSTRAQLSILIGEEV
ncbi:MAG TPA: TolC family protein [Oligoflexia bacterium]|nr:TolC family protein [Oligoflexia bacterium]